MSKTFSFDERKLLTLFNQNASFVHKDIEYVVKMSGKPKAKGGEPKTDIYVMAVSKQGDELELKISYKKLNADFLENKIKKERAEEIFGSNWERIIVEATTKLKEKFLTRQLVYKESRGRTEKGSITLGWKFEFTNKPSGELSAEMDLTQAQLIDVYAGTNLPESKKDAEINGVMVKNSGVANFMCVGENLNTVQEVVDSLVSISEYVEKNPKIYFACKALNYRTIAQKYDGNRPLAVQVDWILTDDSKLDRVIEFEKPLSWNGKDVAENLIEVLEQLKVQTTDDISVEMLENPSIIGALEIDF